MDTPIQRTMAAIRQGTIAEFRQLLAEHPGLLNEASSHLLEHAATNDRVDVLGLLIAAGVDLNAATLGDTTLGAAAREGTVETVRWLLDRGADVNGGAEPGDSTPLEEAIMEGRLEMVELLLERGADPDILHGNPRRNALASAKFWGHDDVAAFLESRKIAEIVIEPEPVDVEAPAFLDPGDPLIPSAWFDKKWGHVYNFATRHGLDALGEKNRVLFLVGYLISQLADGGASMVYANPSAEYVAEMPAALDKIGATHAARTIRDINALFPGGSPAKDHESRMEQIRALSPEARRLGDVLEEIFDEWLPDGGERSLVAQLHDFYHA